MAFHQAFPKKIGLFATLLAQGKKVLAAESDMASFVVKDSSKKPHSGKISGVAEPRLHGRGNIEPAGLEHHGNHRQPCRCIVPGGISRVPQAGVRGERAIVAAKRAQPPLEQGEMHRLVGGNREEIADELRAKLCAESPCRIEREVDRRKFDMREGMPQGDPRPFRSAAPALGHAVRGQQRRARGARRVIGHRRIESAVQAPQPPVARNLARRHRLGARIGGEQHGADRGGDSDPAQSACAAASTSAAWPLTLTLSHTRAIRPSGPTR